MHRGYIKLWRASVDNKLYFHEPFTKWQAWMDILILANHKDATVPIRGIMVEVKRGQVITGEDYLADRWKWSRGKVRRFLQYLEGETVQQIVQQKSNVITLISIVNWELYQSDSTANGTAFEPSNSTANGQQTDTPKNDKECKEDTTIPPIIPQDHAGEIFTVFEANCQKLTPQVTDALNDLIDTYSGERVLYAVKESIKHNKRSLAYIEGILKGNNNKPAGRIPTRYTDPSELEENA